MNDEMRAELAKSAGMLQLLADVGAGAVSVQLAEITRSFHGLPPLDAETSAYVEGPIVVHNGTNGWGIDWDGHPVHRKMFRDQVMKERIDIALGLSPWRVSPTEIMLVWYAATMDGPLSAHGGAFYIWAAAHALSKVSAHNTVAAVREMMFPQGRAAGGHHVLTDEEVLDPRSPYNHFYSETCRAIRHMVAKNSGRKGRRPRGEDLSSLWTRMELNERLSYVKKKGLLSSTALADHPPTMSDQLQANLSAA